MQHEGFFQRFDISQSVTPETKSASRKVVIGIILLVALVAFEIFNFDTTRFALNSILGEVAFFGIAWATILAIAFCAIDFAGLARMFTPERGLQERKAVWFLMGAWLLGATMNAIMTWWAVSLTLLSHDFGNEVLGREQLLTIVPIFVAALVLLTRILFIGAFSIAGEQVFDLAGDARAKTTSPAVQPALPKPVGEPVRSSTVAPQPAAKPATPASRPQPVTSQSGPGGRTNRRPMPTPGVRPTAPAPMSAKPKQ